MHSRLRRLVFTTAAVAGLTAPATAAPAGRMLYERSSRDVYDAAVVVGPREFVTESLLSTFRAFCATQCTHRKLARLRASTNEHDLQVTGNVSLPDMLPGGIPDLLSLNPGYLGTAIGTPDIAQVLCLGGEATALVRRGDRMASYQISGSHDSREMSVSGLNLTVVGFSFRAAPVPSSGGERSASPDFLWVFARTKNLPSAKEADAVRRELESRIGVRSFLTLRTDPFFFDYGGPITDVFEIPPAEVSVAEFLTRPFIACWPADSPDGSGGCQLRNTHTGLRPRHY
jgi:hypothetical protein